MAPEIEFRGNLTCTLDYIPRHVQFMGQDGARGTRARAFEKLLKAFESSFKGAFEERGARHDGATPATRRSWAKVSLESAVEMPMRCDIPRSLAAQADLN